MSAFRTKMVEFAKGVIAHSSDWQEVQHALFDHNEFGQWLESIGDDGVAIIRAAEASYGQSLPPGYSN